MLEVLVLFEHRRFIDVIVGRNSVIVRVFGQPFHIFQIVAADVDVEKNQVVINILLAQNVFEILLRRNECFRQAGLEIPRVLGKVEHRNSGIAEAVCEFRPQQSPIGRDIYPKSFFCSVINDLVNEVRP